MKSKERWLRLCLLLMVAMVFATVVRHPGEVLYSETSDLIAQHHPFRTLQVRSLHERGRPQLWNPTSFGGMPLIGDPQAGIWYPPNWLNALAPLENSHAWFGWGAILHLVIGGCGMLWWLRGHAFAPWSRLAAAVAFAFCGKWLYHVLDAGQIVFLPLVWVPWQCGLIDRIISRGSPIACAGLAWATALAITGLHPQLLLFSQLQVLAYAVFCLAVQSRAGAGVSRTRASVALVGSGFLALALTAGRLLPIVDSLEFFVRGEGVSYAEAAKTALGTINFKTLLLPFPIDSGRWEASCFVGVVALAIAAFSPWRRRERGVTLFFFGSLVFCFWYALGERWGLHPFLFHWVPGFDLFRYPMRMLLLVGVPLGYLVASGVEVLAEGPPSRARSILALALLLLGVAVLALDRSLDGAIVLLALALPALTELPRRTRGAVWIAPALALALFADAARFAMPLVRTRPYTEALGSNPVVERLRGPWGQGRVLGVNRRHADDRSAIPVTYATPFGIEGVRGFNPLIPRSTYALLRAGVGGLKLDWEPAMTIRSFPLRNRRYLDLFNVRWIVANRPVHLDGLVQRDRFDDLRIYHFQSPSALTHMPTTYLYENPHALPRAALVRTARLERDSSAALRAVGTFDPRQVVLVEEPSLAGSYPGGFEELAVAHEGDRIALDFDAGEGGYVVLSEIFYPGWQAEDQGQPLPVGRANGVFQVLRVGPGHHEIVLRYFPTSFAIGLWLSLGAALLSGGLVLLGWLKGRSDTQ
jgi:hypothetical protein